MIILSVLIYLPLKIIAAFGLSMVLFHNLLDNINSEQFGSFKILWLILHEEGAINWGTDGVFWVVYPVIPWVGVMASGYVFGKLFTINFDKRKKILLIIGVILTIIFIILRYLNFYGDPSPRIQHESFLFSFMSFLNCTKYPPSLLFLLMTIGPSIILLSVLENVKNRC